MEFEIMATRAFAVCASRSIGDDVMDGKDGHDWLWGEDSGELIQESFSAARLSRRG